MSGCGIQMIINEDDGQKATKLALFDSVSTTASVMPATIVDNVELQAIETSSLLKN